MEELIGASAKAVVVEMVSADSEAAIMESIAATRATSSEPGRWCVAVTPARASAASDGVSNLKRAKKKRKKKEKETTRAHAQPLERAHV